MCIQRGQYVVALLLVFFGPDLGHFQSLHENEPEMTQEEFKKCYEMYSPALLKHCGPGGNDEFLKRAAECALELELELPCYLEWIVNDTTVDFHNCTGREEEDIEQQFSRESREKCFDTCIAKKMRMFTADDMKPDADACISYLESLPVFRGQPMSSEEREGLITCLETVTSDERDSESSDPACLVGSIISDCTMMVIFQTHAGSSDCPLEVCHNAMKSDHLLE